MKHLWSERAHRHQSHKHFVFHLTEDFIIVSRLGFIQYYISLVESKSLFVWEWSWMKYFYDWMFRHDKSSPRQVDTRKQGICKCDFPVTWTYKLLVSKIRGIDVDQNLTKNILKHGIFRMVQFCWALKFSVGTIAFEFYRYIGHNDCNWRFDLSCELNGELASEIIQKRCKLWWNKRGNAGEISL